MILYRLERSIALALTGMLAFSVVAVPLAMVGAFRPLPVLVATVVVWLALWRLWGRDPVSVAFVGSDTRRATTATSAVLVFVVLITVVNVRYSSQHLLTERDPGVYNTTAISMAKTGGIIIHPETAVYGEEPKKEHRVNFEAAGFFLDIESEKIYPQFLHLFQATLGASSWVVGERGMLKVNAILGGLALLVFFVFCSRILPIWGAAAATAALGLNLVQVNFTRDSYTEVLTQILLIGALWALVIARSTRNARRAWIAGALIGAAIMARADAFLFLIPLTVYILYELDVASKERDSALRRYLIALGSGAALTTSIASIDLRVFSPWYLADNWEALRLAFVGLVAVAVGGALYLRMRARLGSVRGWFLVHRKQLAAAAAVGIVVVAALVFFVRPHIQHTYDHEPSDVVRLAQMREGLTVDPSRTFAENSLEWLALYLGHVTLWTGLGGFALITREIILGRLRDMIPFVFAFGSMTALYLWDPGITPDHLWAMRRYLPITIPGLIICSFWLLARIWRRASFGRRSSAVRGAVVAVAALAIVFPMWTLAPFIRARSQVGVLNATEQLCDRLPENAAVLVAQTQLLDQNYMQTVRSVCGVPVASAPMDQPLDYYGEFARGWSAAGRDLYVVSPLSKFGTFWDPGADHVASVRYEEIERTLRGRPDGYESFELTLFVRRVDPEVGRS